MKRLLAFLLSALLIFTMTGCGRREEHSAKFRIVASFYPIYIMALNLTENIPDVVVDNMAGQQTGCLHDYQLQSSDMQNLSSANVFLINGDGMESFLQKIAQQLPNLEIIDSSKGIQTIPGEGDEEVNPHIWVSISNAILQVENLSQGLQKADPEHAAQYDENAHTYEEKLKTLRGEMHQAVDPLPNKAIVTFHEAFPYFAEEFGLTIAKVVNREPDSQPSAKELAETIHIVEESGVKAVFAEPQYPKSAADIVAKESGIKVYSLDPAVTGANDPNAYLDAMRSNMEVLKEALS